MIYSHRRREERVYPTPAPSGQQNVVFEGENVTLEGEQVIYTPS